MKQTVATILVALFLTIAHWSPAQPRKMKHQKSTADLKRWEVADISFSLNRKTLPSNPFDVTFGATFKGPDRETLQIPGFYNGEGEFIVRFSAGSEGLWTYETFSSMPELAARKGSFRVAANDDPGRHGAVTVGRRLPQHFIYEDSSSYFALAFELDWLFALDYHNASDIPNTKKIVESIKQNGFNQVVMNVYAYDVGWKTASDVPARYEFRRPDFFPFQGSNENPDFSSLNTEYFKHFDRVIAYLHEQNIVAHMMIYVWNKKVRWPEMYSAADNRFFDYVISRYQAFPNVIWDVSKEALDYGRCDIPYINERIGRIRKQDAYRRLVTVHDYEYCSREPQRVDFISIQSWRSDLYSRMLEARIAHDDKPVMNIEHGGYEAGPYTSFYGDYTAPETCLVRNYQSVFAGVYSSYYWQNTSWNIVVYDPFVSEDVTVKPRFDYYKHMTALFQRYDYNELFPARPKITTNGRIGEDNLATSGYFLSNGKDLYLYFLPEDTEFTHAIVPKRERNEIVVSYFNPFTGDFSKEERTPWGGWKELTSPWPGTACVAILKTE